MRNLALLLLAASCASTPAAPPAPVVEAAAMPPPPAPAAVTGPHGERDVLVIEPSGGDRPLHVQLLADGDAVVALDPPSLRLVPLEGESATLALEAPADVVADRLLVASVAGAARAAVGLAGAGHATRVAGGEKVRDAPGLRPCAIAAREGELAVLAERLPQPGSSAAEVLLLRAKGRPVPLGQHAVGDLCAAAPRKAPGFLVAWMDVRGRLLVRAIDGRGRAAGSTSAMPLAKGDRLISPAMAALPGGGAIVVGTSKKDGAVRAFLVNDRGRPRAGPIDVTPPHGEGPTGGAAVAALPGGGFAVAFHAAELTRDDAPTALRLVFTDGGGQPRGAPITVIEGLALAPDPAAVAAHGDGVLVAAIVSGEGGPRARVVRVPGDVTGQEATPPPPRPAPPPP